MHFVIILLLRFSKEDAIPTTRRASKVCTSLITARTNEEITVFDKALLEVDIAFHFEV